MHLPSIDPMIYGMLTLDSTPPFLSFDRPTNVCFSPRFFVGFTRTADSPLEWSLRSLPKESPKDDTFSPIDLALIFCPERFLFFSESLPLVSLRAPRYPPRLRVAALSPKKASAQKRASDKRAPNGERRKKCPRMTALAFGRAHRQRRHLHKSAARYSHALASCEARLSRLSFVP